jgi:DNA-binding transcriptional regulator YiaG
LKKPKAQSRVKFLTNAELKTLMESCGLTVADFAQIMGNRSRTVMRWLAASFPIPDDAANTIVGIDKKITQEAAHTAEVAQAELGDRGVVLIRFRDIEDLVLYRPESAELGLGVHGALTDRVRQALVRQGIVPRIVFMDRHAYEDWLDRVGKMHNEKTLAEWAYVQVDSLETANSHFK